ncbi:MAG: RecQ family ATP-dependent DNA helicase [Bacteroidales bacterium]|nr:RecQ family ATP-dependent DNA helicase [Bacteroidales bacterium]
MSQQARETLRQYWGYDSFRPCQEDIIDSVLAGHDTIGLMPTGGGKSITFQVPALILPGITLVITPLISLMKDQVDNLRARHIKAIALHSGLSHRENRVALNHLESGRIKILYASPEKLQSDKFRSLLRRLKISLIVVDEAHCISQWGYDFRPSYLNISIARRELPGVPILALTASATPQVVDDIATQLQFASRDHIFRLSFDRHNLSYLTRFCEDKESKMVEILSRVAGTAIVYVRSRKRTLELAARLSAEGITAEAYHAGLIPELKTERQNRWKSGETRVVVATNAFGMGIDKPDVRVVIHYDLPPSLEEYYQEAGRAGRDGLESLAVMLIAPSDKGVLTRRLTMAFPPRDFIKGIYTKLCVFLNIGIEEGYNTLKEFNIRQFCERFKLNPAMTDSAISIIARSGYIEYLEDYNSQSRIMIGVDKEELYNLRVSHNADTVLNTILRSYTGLFADYEYISESVIASRASLTEREVYEALLELARARAIHYVPRTSNPMILFTRSRVDERNVQIPLTVYEHRRDSMKKRIEAMKKFAFETSGCRVNTLLEYFGEKPVKPCGKCDYCRVQRKRQPAPSSATASAEETVRLILGFESPIALKKLITSSNLTPDDIIAAVRKLADKGEIAITGDTLARI